MRSRRKYKCLQWELNSKLEDTVARDLINRGIEFTYETESFGWLEKLPRAFCTNCGEKMAYAERSYTPDFFLPNGIIVEVKGRFTSHDRKIAAAMKEQHPELDIRMLFQSDNWMTRKHKTKYSDWCNSKEIMWATGTVPEGWLCE